MRAHTRCPGRDERSTLAAPGKQGLAEAAQNGPWALREAQRFRRLRISEGPETCTGEVMGTTATGPFATTPSASVIFSLGGEFRAQQRHVSACVSTSCGGVYLCPGYEDRMLLTALLFMCASGAQSCLVNEAQPSLLGGHVQTGCLSLSVVCHCRWPSPFMSGAAGNRGDQEAAPGWKVGRADLRTAAAAQDSEDILRGSLLSSSLPHSAHFSFVDPASNQAPLARGGRSC